MQRFLETLYLGNQTDSLPSIARLYKTYRHDQLFLLKRSSPLVSIAVYSVMPTHYHLLLQPRIEGGLTKFMHKLGTGFVRYYNERCERFGNLFVRPFRARHVSENPYFMHVPNYIHLNAAELFETNWKSGRVRNLPILKKNLLAYPYSSLRDYAGFERVQKNILDNEMVQLFKEILPNFEDSVEDAYDYYSSLELE